MKKTVFNQERRLSLAASLRMLALLIVLTAGHAALRAQVTRDTGTGTGTGASLVGNYKTCRWNGSEVVTEEHKIPSCNVITLYTTTWEAGQFYVLNTDSEITSQITVNGTDDNQTTLILCDGHTLTASGGILLPEGHKLIICEGKTPLSSSYGGELSVSGNIGGGKGGTGEIGSNGGNGGNGGTVTIYGGTLSATTIGGGAGGKGGTGEIGGNGGNGGNGGTVNIYGGTLTATDNIGGGDGGVGGAGLKGGNGGNGGNGGTVNIYGGTLTATGNIGGGDGGVGGVCYDGGKVSTSGSGGSSGTVNYYGGTVDQSFTGSPIVLKKSGTTFSLPTPINVDGVEIDRTFTASQASTVFLPFGIAKSKVTGGKFYTFTSVDETKSPWEVKYTEVTDNLVANTPYIFMPDGTNEGKIVVNNGSDKISLKTAAGSTQPEGIDWEFIGTYSPITWATGHADLGKVYGFAAQAYTEGGVSAGDFVKATAGASIAPLRAYLKRTSAYSATRAAESVLPDRMKVVLISANGDATALDDEWQIEHSASERSVYYDLSGRRLSGKPTKRGVYVCNGRLVVF